MGVDADSDTETFTMINDIYNYDLPPKSRRMVIPHQRKFSPMAYEVVLNFHRPFPMELLHGEQVESIHVCSVTEGPSFYRNLLETYPDLDDLIRQFNLDVTRSVMYLNQHRVRRPIQAVHYLQHRYTHHAKLILALCTQAIYASPFEWLYFSLPTDYHLVERAGTGRDSLRKIKIMLDDNRLSVWKMLRIIRFVTDPRDGTQTSETYREVCLVVTIEDITSGTDDVGIDVWLGPVLTSD